MCCLPAKPRREPNGSAICSAATAGHTFCWTVFSGIGLSKPWANWEKPGRPLWPSGSAWSTRASWRSRRVLRWKGCVRCAPAKRPGSSASSSCSWSACVYAFLLSSLEAWSMASLASSPRSPPPWSKTCPVAGATEQKSGTAKPRYRFLESRLPLALSGWPILQLSPYARKIRDDSCLRLACNGLQVRIQRTGVRRRRPRGRLCRRRSRVPATGVVSPSHLPNPPPLNRSKGPRCSSSGLDLYQSLYSSACSCVRRPASTNPSSFS